MASSSEGNKKDPAWKYAHLVNPQNPNKFKCNFCGKESSGGVYRVKQHLAGNYTSVITCPKCPAHVREEIREYMAKKKEEKNLMNMVPDFDEMPNDLEEDEDDIVEIVRKRSMASSSQSSTQATSRPKKPRQKGPMDVYFTPDPNVAMQNRKTKGRQTNIDANDPFRKEMRERAITAFARWMYDTGIPFNVVNYESFAAMFEAIGQYGPGLKPPSYHEVRVPLLNKEVGRIKSLMKDHQEDWAKYGCSIMADGWTDKRGRTLINFLVNCPKGTMFLESVDASAYSKDGQKMYELLDIFVEGIGEPNVVQIVTDSAAANVLAGMSFLKKKDNYLLY